MSNKSVSFQNKYNGVLTSSNTSLSKYLKSLNGSKATMGGYIKSLIGAKAASIGLQVATAALEMTITMGLSFAITALISLIQKWANAQEEARQKSVELTNSYKEQQSSLDSQIEKYKELKRSLDLENISTDEARSLKEQLLEVQQSLMESYGEEAYNIDLVNGKYREQLELLGELSKEKATEYVNENRDVFKDAKKALEKERTYNLGTVTSWNTYSPKTEEQQALLDYIESYSDLLELTASGSSTGSVYSTSMNLSVKADVENADELMHQFAEDLERYGKENNIDVSGILEGVSEQLKKTWTDELTEYKTVYDEFMKAEIVRNDTLRPLYEESIQAVEDYNNALSSGEGIDEAKENLESVQKSVQNATGELEGSQDIFDDIYDGINKDAEAAYNLSQAFQNDKTVQNYAEQLRGLTDVDLKSINFDNENIEKGEEAFKSLVETLGLNEDQVQNLIDKLIELGYVYGGIRKEIIENEIDLSPTITETVDAIHTKLKPAMDSLANAYTKMFTENGFTHDGITTSEFTGIKEALDAMKESGLEIDYDEYENFVKVLSDVDSTSDDVHDAFDSMATMMVNASGVVDVTEENFDLLKQQLEELGVTNAEEVLTNIRNIQNELTESGINLTEVTYEEAGAFLASGEASAIASEYLRIYMFQKALAENPLNTAADIEALEELCGTLGITGEYLEKLAHLKYLYASADAGGLWSDYTIQNEIAKTKAELDSIAQEEYQYKVDFDFDGNLGGGSGSGSSSPFDWSDLLDKEIKLLEKQLDAGLIDFDTYLNKRLDLINQYYNEGKIAADEYYAYLEATYDNQISIYDKVISAVTKKLNDQIEDLEKQKEVIEESYQLQIDKIQTEIDLLQKEADKKQDLIDLEKARYEAERARTQRTLKLYNGQEFIYTNDPDSVRDAEEELADRELQFNISTLQEKIDALEKEMNDATEQIDIQIEHLQEYIEQWSEVAEAFEIAQNEMLAAQVLGADWESQIFAMRQDALEQFKNNYIAAQQEMANAAWKAAEAQINAAKEAAKGVNGVVGSTDVTNGGGETTWSYNGNSYNTEQDAQAAKTADINSAKTANTNTSIPSSVRQAIVDQIEKRKITKHAKGGVIGKDDDFLSSIAKSVGEDTMVAAKEGERILTPLQNENFEKLINIADKLVPVLTDIPFANLVNRNLTPAMAGSSPVNFSIGEIHLHEVQNVPDFAKALQTHLPNISIQYNGK